MQRPRRGHSPAAIVNRRLTPEQQGLVKSSLLTLRSVLCLQHHGRHTPLGPLGGLELCDVTPVLVRVVRLKTEGRHKDKK